jgi:hypothetical protein
VFGLGVVSNTMKAVTKVLSAIERGDPKAAEELLPLVYDEFRKLAGQKLDAALLPGRADLRSGKWYRP